MKTSKKQIKKMKEIQVMIETIERSWSKKISYNCVHCLKEAYNSIINNTNGYITDEELINHSNGRLKHK